eukprot:m.47548 g.47548  ORF g.47548 m.47548 type:complete len:565 (+) comp7339_c0_seq1:88-1782(+)
MSFWSSALSTFEGQIFVGVCIVGGTALLYLNRDRMEYLNSFLGTTSTTATVTILGVTYFEEDQVQKDEAISDLIWLTYRKNFEPIHGDEQLSSDTGWGCTYRSGQMIMAEALYRHLLWEERREKKRNLRNQEKLWCRTSAISYFQDVLDSSAHLSIQKMAHEVFKVRKRPGQWISPGESVFLLSQLAGQLPIRVYLAHDSMLSIKRLVGKKEWRPTVVFIPLRLGLDRFEPAYSRALKAFFSLPQCIGVVGGKPGSSFYFVGFEAESNHLLYLDPHTTKNPLILGTHGHENGFDGNNTLINETCSCSRLKRMSFSSASPSVCLGLFFPSLQDVANFSSQLKKERDGHEWVEPLFAFQDDLCLSISEEPHEFDDGQSIRTTSFPSSRLAPTTTTKSMKRGMFDDDVNVEEAKEEGFDVVTRSLIASTLDDNDYVEENNLEEEEEDDDDDVDVDEVIANGRNNCGWEVGKSQQQLQKQDNIDYVSPPIASVSSFVYPHDSSVSSSPEWMKIRSRYDSMRDLGETDDEDSDTNNDYGFQHIAISDVRGSAVSLEQQDVEDDFVLVDN